jgi:hypothetical protein
LAEPVCEYASQEVVNAKAIRMLDEMMPCDTLKDIEIDLGQDDE